MIKMLKKIQKVETTKETRIKTLVQETTTTHELFVITFYVAKLLKEGKNSFPSTLYQIASELIQSHRLFISLYLTIKIL